MYAKRFTGALRSVGQSRLLALALGGAIALGTGLSAKSAFADNKAPPAKPAPPAKGKGKEPAKPAEAAEPPMVKNPVTIAPKEIAWGIDRNKLAQIYDKVLDEDYKPRYKKVRAGPDMEALDAEVAEKKAEFRRSYLEFGNLPTGVDASPLKGEYTYKNKEAMMSITRGGKTRYFFFIQGRMWKIIDELKLGEGAAWGKDFVEAAAKLAKAYAVEGRVRAPDPSQSRSFQEVDWKDTNTQVRAVDWPTGKFGLAFQDLATVGQLGSLRTAKPDDSGKVDPSVNDVMRTPSKKPEPPPPPDKKPGAKPAPPKK